MFLERLKQFWEIVKVQFKLILRNNFVLTILLGLLTPFVFGMKNLDAYGSSFVLERFIALSGVILLTPLFLPEQDKSVAELVEARYTSQIKVIVLRLITSLLFMAIYVLVIVAMMRLQQCEFDTIKFFAGTYITAFFLGTLGFVFYGITNNIVAGYLVTLSYYLLNVMQGIKLKEFYLFSLAIEDFTPKYWLCGSGIILVLFTLTWRHIAAKIK